MTAPDHELAPLPEQTGVRYEFRAVAGPHGKTVDGLATAWITLDNPRELNSYTTEMLKAVILAFRKASNAQDVVAVVFTGAGERAFCTGGNTREYAEVYAGRPELYRQYMRLFNDMVTSILECDKPVINRVNGMRVAGGQEIGMACDFSVASDRAVFGQAGPRHGSAPDGGSTDFLPLFVGIEQAMLSATLCELWSAHKARRLNLVSEVVPVLKLDSGFIPNPLAVTDRWIDAAGRIVYGELKTGDELARARELAGRAQTDLALLDEAVDRLVASLVQTFPGCLTKTLGSLRKHKLAHWDRNRESNREWLALNMLTEAKAGFRAFHEGPKGNREADVIGLRQALARGEAWSEELIQRIQPKKQAD